MVDHIERWRVVHLYWTFPLSTAILNSNGRWVDLVLRFYNAAGIRNRTGRKRPRLSLIYIVN